MSIFKYYDETMQRIYTLEEVRKMHNELINNSSYADEDLEEFKFFENYLKTFKQISEKQAQRIYMNIYNAKKREKEKKLINELKEAKIKIIQLETELKIIKELNKKGEKNE